MQFLFPKKMTLIGSDNILINAPKVLKVERPYYEQEQLNDELKYSKPINRKYFFYSFKNSMIVCV